MTKIYVSGFTFIVDDGTTKNRRPVKDVRYTVTGTTYLFQDSLAVKYLDRREIARLSFANITDESGAAYASQAAFETFLNENTAGFNRGGKVGIGSTITSAAYTLVKKDALKQPSFNSPTAQVITVDAAVFTEGDVIVPWREGVGTVEIMAGAGVTLKGVTDTTGKRFIADQYSYIAIIAESPTVFRITGNLNRL